MKSIANILLTWRKGRGETRQVVGIIKNNGSVGVRFKYIITPEQAEQIGFTTYTDFPDLKKEYSDNVIEIFGQRLTKSDRSDIQKYYDFWNIDEEHKTNKFYLLAHTQGILATDNFEFLADYMPTKKMSFTSEVCGLSINKIAVDTVSEGEELRWEKDPLNKYDKKAIKVFKGDKYLGNIKRVHCNVFSKKNGNKLKIKVKSIDKNGDRLNKLFVTVYNPQHK